MIEADGSETPSDQAERMHLRNMAMRITWEIDRIDELDWGNSDLDYLRERVIEVKERLVGIRNRTNQRIHESAAETLKKDSNND